MDKKTSLPCILCSKVKDCDESFLCSSAFGLRIVLSLAAAVGLVAAMSFAFPHVFSTVAPDSYSVTGHPMDEVKKKRDVEASDAGGVNREALGRLPTGEAPDQGS